MADALAIAAEIIKRPEIEGFRSKPYLCPAKVWTIGYGSTRDAAGKPVTANTPPVNETEATRLVIRDLGDAARTVDRLVTVYLTTNQKAALIDFVYNLGPGAFASSTLLKKLNASDYKGASEEFGKWVYSGGKVLNGLVNRRKIERDLFVKDMLPKDIKLV